MTATLDVPIGDGRSLRFEPVQRQRGRLGLKDFDPCTILLNSGLPAGVPQVLQGLYEQYLLPPLHAGWTVRRKSNHLQAYEEVCKRFAKLLGMDPWLLYTLWAAPVAVDRGSAAGLEALQTQVEAVLQKVRRKYKEYGITDKPYAVIKADDAPDDAGVLVVREARELDAQALEQALEGAWRVGRSTSLLVQEGVPSYERLGDAVAEPVVTMIDRYVVGGTYRVNPQGRPDDDLCSPEASFVPLGFAQTPPLGRPGQRSGDRPGAGTPNRFYMYGVVARLGMVGAAYELEATDPEAESDD